VYVKNVVRLFISGSVVLITGGFSGFFEELKGVGVGVIMGLAGWYCCLVYLVVLIRKMMISIISKFIAIFIFIDATFFVVTTSLIFPSCCY